MLLPMHVPLLQLVHWSAPGQGQEVEAPQVVVEQVQERQAPGCWGPGTLAARLMISPTLKQSEVSDAGGLGVWD